MSDEVLVTLVRQGRKVECPVCGRRAMSQSYSPFSSSGIGQHIRSSHPELEAEVYAATRRVEQRIKNEQRRDRREAVRRPIREHTVTGAFLDELKSEIESLIGMMEPYYAQGDCADDGIKMIERIEALHQSAMLAERAKGGDQ